MEWSWGLTIQVGMLLLNGAMFCVIKFNDFVHLNREFRSFKADVKSSLDKNERQINKMSKDIVAIKVRCYERYRCGSKK